MKKIFTNFVNQFLIMIVIFEKSYLKELYENGKSSDKNCRFQPDIVKRYINSINYLKRAPSKESLFPIKSLHFEALKGDKKGLFSVKVNNKYRVEFSLSENFEQPILSICNIVELSNHYK